MEDQPADTGDLTAEQSALVPQGKSARRRHRLPRRDLKQTDDGAEPAEGVTPDDEIPSEGEPEVVSEPEHGPEPVPEPEAEQVAAPEPVRRSRFGFRRKKSADAESAPVAEPAEPAEPVEAVPAEPVEAEAEVTTSDEAPPVVESTVEDAESEAPETAEEPEPVMVPHRPAGRPLKVAAAVAGALVVSASAFAGAQLQPYLSDRAEVQIKVDVARTATEAITTLWTYTPEDIDKLGQRASKYLGGDLATQYRDFIDGIVEANKQAQVTNQTQVVGAAVESLTPTEATALVFTNTTATSPVTKNIPSLRYVSYRLTLERRGQQWLVTRMPNITSLDLTPRL